MDDRETGWGLGKDFIVVGFKRSKAKGEFENRYCRNEPENKNKAKRTITMQRS